MFITSIVDECQDNPISYVLNNFENAPLWSLECLTCVVLLSFFSFRGGYTNRFCASVSPSFRRRFQNIT